MNDVDAGGHLDSLRQQTVLARFGELALKSDDLDEILTEACRLVGEALGTDLAKVMELQGDGKTLLVRAGVGWKPGVVGEATTTVAEDTSEGHALKTGEPMISPDISKETRFRYPPFLTESGVQAVANVIIIGTKDHPPFGLLQIDSRAPREFTDNDTAFLTSYANLLAAAVERLRAVDQLRESDVRFRAALDIGTVGVIFFDVGGSVTEANGAFLRMSGFSRGDVSAGLVRWDAMTPAEHMPASLRAMRELKEAGQTAPFEKEYTRKDGSRWWALCAPKRIAGSEGVEFVLDVTERVVTEAKLQDSERRLRTLVEVMPQLVWRADGGGDWTWASPQWADHTGLSAGSSRGKGWLDALHPDDRPQALAAWRDAAESGVFQVDYRLRHTASGRYTWFQSRAVPVHGEGRATLEWIGTSTDINDQVQARAALARSGAELEARVAERTAELMAAEATLRQSHKMEAVGQLTGGIAHDFNNMLQAIGGSLELLGRRLEQRRLEDAPRLLGSARATVERAASLTHRLLAFARRQALQPRPVEPDALVRGLAELIGRTAGPGIRVEVRPRDGVWTVLCDPNQLENVLLNLAINARDAMPDGGTLTIGTRDVHLSARDVAGQDGAEPGDYVEIAVADTGRGMDEATRARAFEPFFTTKPIGQGTGLGLSQLYGFVQQSGGAVRLDSAPGRGTTVRLFLPRHALVQDTDPQPATTAGPDAVAAGAVLLLVEDEDNVRAVTAEALRDLGHTVLEARDGPAALRLLHDASEARIDLLVTDVGLPGGLNGRQVADAARTAQPELPVLFVTGYAGTVLDDQLAPGMAVISKPFTLEALTAKVRQMLESMPKPARC